ncbi:MAG: AI-2E family transporter [Clostridia bacterium]|nr:AI-2E family transporter [Clostridia bacterium]
MQLSKDTKRFFVRLSAFTVLLVLLVRHFPSIGFFLTSTLTTLMPFIVGACLAFVLSVPMSLFERLLGRKDKKGRPLFSEKKRRPLALVFSILLLALLVALLGVIVVPQLIETVSSLAGSVMRFVPTAQEWIADFRVWLADYPEIQAIVEPYIPDVNQMASAFLAFVQKYAGLIAGNAVSTVSSFFGSATDVIISFVFAIYVLLQKTSLSRQCQKLIYAFLPKNFCDEALRVARMTHHTFFSYVAIQCLEALILGGLCFVGMLIFRFPHALVISVIMTFCALIPIYGAIASCVIGAFLILFENPLQAVGFVVFILVLQQIETNLIYPRVVSTSINLPSMWVLLAVTVGGGMFGIVGMITAVPLTSIVYTLLGETTSRRLRERNLTPADFATDETDKQGKTDRTHG